MIGAAFAGLTARRPVGAEPARACVTNLTVGTLGIMPARQGAPAAVALERKARDRLGRAASAVVAHPLVGLAARAPVARAAAARGPRRIFLAGTLAVAEPVGSARRRPLVRALPVRIQNARVGRRALAQALGRSTGHAGAGACAVTADAVGAETRLALI